jgi:hypothetical protein
MELTKVHLMRLKQYGNVLTKEKKKCTRDYLHRCFFVVVDGDSGFSASSNNQPMFRALSNFLIPLIFKLGIIGRKIRAITDAKSRYGGFDRFAFRF